VKLYSQEEQKRIEAAMERFLDLGHGIVSAAAPVAAADGAVYNPLAPPTISGTSFTIDYALQNPTTVITPDIIDLTEQRFFVDRVFSSAGGVTGGAVVFNIAAMEQYAARDVQNVNPGAEFPVLTFERNVPGVALVEKWGGKFAITWEARDRNNVSEYNNAVRQLANTIVRKINQRGVAELDAAVTAFSRTLAGNNWTTVVTGGSSQSNHTLWPARDFGKLAMVAAQEERGVDFNLLIMNPLNYADLVSIYGDDLNAMLAGFGLSIFVTNRVTAGTYYAVAEGQVGEMRLEQPLLTRTWDDANGIEQTWVQSSVRPLMFVNNPYAVLKVTGAS